MNTKCAFNGIELAQTVTLSEQSINAQLAKATLKSLIKNRKGFTLAETLITLTIIGVIAAVTVPTLVTNYQKHTYVTGVKKAYSQLENAMRMTLVSQNCSGGDYECAFNATTYTNSQGETQSRIFTTFVDMDTLMKQFNYVKKTLGSEDTLCRSLINTGAFACYTTPDGMIYGSSYGCGTIPVDINGNKGPNKRGVDRFAFSIANETRNGVVQGTILPFGSKIFQQYWGYANCPYLNCDATSIKNGGESAFACTARVLETGKMDY